MVNEPEARKVSHWDTEQRKRANKLKDFVKKRGGLVNTPWSLA
jgi:hypothetical protein